MPWQKYYDLRTQRYADPGDHIKVVESSDDRFMTLVPHGGTLVPMECMPNLNLDGLIIDADHYTQEIFSLADYGSTVVTYLIHRGVIDINRDLEKPLQKEDGVFRKKRFDGEPVMLEPYSPELEQRLIEGYYRTFINAVENKIHEFLDKHDRAVIINGHSMEHRPRDNRPGICIANNSQQGNNPTSDAYLFELIYESLQDHLRSYSEIRDAMKRLPKDIQKHHPFRCQKGLPVKFGRPDMGMDSVLLEINQNLYLDYESVKMGPMGGKDEKMIGLLNQYIGKSLHEAISIVC